MTPEEEDDKLAEINETNRQLYMKQLRWAAQLIKDTEQVFTEFEVSAEALKRRMESLDWNFDQMVKPPKMELSAAEKKDWVDGVKRGVS